MVDEQMENDEQATSTPRTSPSAPGSRVACKAPSWHLPKGVIFPDYALTLQPPYLINGGEFEILLHIYHHTINYFTYGQHKSMCSLLRW